MPSLAAFEALLADKTRQAGRYRRIAALADNYSMITYPTLVEMPGAPGREGWGNLQITDTGVGTPCSNDADCVGIGACITDGSGSRFCTRACGSGEFGDPYVCCSGCSELVASQLPFTGTACLIEDIAEQLRAPPASCTCD